MKILTLLAFATLAFSQTRPVTDAEVMRVHKSALLIDTHNDVTSRTVEGFDIGERNTSDRPTMTDLPRMRDGGMGAQFFAVYVAAGYVNGNHAANRTLQMIDTVRHDIVARYPNDFAFATTAADIEAAHRQGKIAALMGIEGGHAIEDSLRLLRDYYALGIRYMTLTHTNTNNWADSSGDIDRTDVAHHNGLTDFGKDVVREMNRLGMMVDISHVSDKTFWDALALSKAPIFASHSSCRALCDVPRNMTDEMIVALAKKGGVVQINLDCGFLSQTVADAEKNARQANAAVRERMQRETAGKTLMAEERRAMMAKIREEMGIRPGPRATLADVVAHIDHVKKIAGVEAIGLGSDFDGIGCSPDGLDDVSKWPNLTRALLEKGYSPEDIRKIYGENLLRVMRGVEAAAGK
ncbi:MAG TPA: membrane dipeptidase [Bryobacteraceae bacterium]|nr:membrane dipeptidase [Bryobacteraceae bacterium]